MNNIKIKVIYDNCRHQDNLQEGWGFSCLIETDHQKILFDTGNEEEAFFSNIEKMNIDLQEITTVLFSHKHADHVAGCKTILGKLKDNVQVYVPKGFSLEKIPPYLQVETVVDFSQIGENIYSMVLKGGFFLYEQILILQKKEGLVVITGCAHPGIVDILKAAQEKLQRPIHLVLGGFHLFRKSAKVTQKIVEEFKALHVEKVAPCHCSGNKTIEQCQEAYKDRCYKIGTGSILVL